MGKENEHSKKTSYYKPEGEQITCREEIMFWKRKLMENCFTYYTMEDDKEVPAEKDQQQQFEDCQQAKWKGLCYSKLCFDQVANHDGKPEDLYPILIDFKSCCNNKEYIAKNKEEWLATPAKVALGDMYQFLMRRDMD